MNSKKTAKKSVAKKAAKKGVKAKVKHKDTLFRDLFGVKNVALERRYGICLRQNGS